MGHFFIVPGAPRSLSEISDRDEGVLVCQMFRSFEANSGTIQQKGSEDLAKASAPAVDPSNLGQAPRAYADFCDPTAVFRFKCLVKRMT